MRKTCLILLMLVILLTAVFAESIPEQSAANLVSTKHSTVIRGQNIDYTATAGTITVKGGDSECDIFFIAYTRDGVEDYSNRPITFAFNGGPGCATIYTNYLCMGPMRMETDELGHATKLPAVLAENANSLLDITDLVFIDAPGTGFSHTDGNLDDFIGYQNDIRSFGDFIYKYLNSNARWSSPLYVAGESYGTTRAVGICEYLADTYSIGLNGLMLISSVNDFTNYLFTDGNEIPYAMFLPTFAADAWYQKCLDKKYQDMSLEDFLVEVRAFVSDEYIPALFKGRSLTDEKKDEIAEKYASYTGLSKEYVLKSNLRVTLDDFCVELLSDQKLMTGRYDGRFTGPVVEGSIDDGSSDPSTFDLDLPLQAAVFQYIIQDLGYQTDVQYVPASMDVNNTWGFDSDNAFFTQESIVYKSMSTNSLLKVWVICGYYDGATPFYGAETVYNHVYLDDTRLKNLSFSYYPAGHMFYLDKDSFNKFREDAEAWYQK